MLEVLVRKTETIRRELGSLSKVIDDAGRAPARRRDPPPRRRPARGRDRARRPRRRPQAVGRRGARGGARAPGRARASRSTAAATCWSARAAGSASRPRRSATRSTARWSCSAPSRCARAIDEQGRPVWAFPPLDARAASDPSWAATLDTLRAPRKTAPEADRLAARGADPPGRVRGRGRADRGDRAPAPRAARRAAAARRAFARRGSSTTISRARAWRRSATRSRA